MKTVLAAILNYKGKKDSAECIESLLSSTYPCLEIVLIDNHSDDGSVEYLKERFPSITHLETGQNLGYAGGNNVAIRYGLEKGHDYIFILNNDTSLSPSCVEEFVKSSALYPDAILGGRVYQYYDPEKLQHLGGIWHQKRGKFVMHPQDLSSIGKEWDEYQPFDFLVGCALFIPASIFKEIGLFEEAFFLHYEEIDFCIRAKAKGFPCIYAPTPKLWHKESASFVEPRPPQMYFQTRNRLFFLKRNLSPKAYRRLLFSKFLHRFFLLGLKCGFNRVLCLYYNLKSDEINLLKQRRSHLAYRAGMQGFIDYFRGKLGNGPSWIYAKSGTKN